MTVSTNTSKNNQSSSFNFDKFFSNLYQSKYWIIGLSLIITFGIVITGLLKTPIYQASATIMIGHYNVPQIVCPEYDVPESCKKEFRPSKALMHEAVVANLMNRFAFKNIDNEIVIINNEDETLKILSNSYTPEQSQSSIKKLISFITELHLDRIENIKNQNSSIIKSMSYKVSNVVDFRVTPLNIKIRNGMKVINKDISLVEEEIIALDEKILIDLLSYEKIKIDSLRAHKNNLTARLKLLNNERYDFINFEIPKFKIELERVKDEVLLRNNIIDDYKLLLNPSSYKNTKLITKIIAPQKPHSPDLFLYLIFGFLSSFSLLLFIFSVLPYLLPSNKNVKIDS